MKEHNYPIFYRDGTCVHCGAEKSVLPINKFGSPCKTNSIYPISSMKCKSCGREYYIRWDSNHDEEFDHPEPVAVSKDYIDLFTKVIQVNSKDKG